MKYTEPSMEIFLTDVEDVIITSGLDNDENAKDQGDW